MTATVLVFLLLQAEAQNLGAITGTVRSATGAPVAGMRVTAQPMNSFPADLPRPAETDELGQYRTELPAGWYYIMFGLASAPTYYPGTSDLSAAQPIGVASGAILEGVDFGSLPAPSRAATGGAASVGGTLSGVVRYPDRTPAVGMNVMVIPSSLAGSLGIPVPPAAPSLQNGRPVLPARVRSVRTDEAGRYSIGLLRGDIYYLAAGFADTPTFYPGISNAAAAKAIVVTDSTELNGLDFTVPRAEPGITIRGRVLTSAGTPAAGGGVRVTNQSSVPPEIASLKLPLLSPVRETTIRTDGTFEFSKVLPGTYTVEAFLSGASQSQSLVVSSALPRTLEFTIPLAMLNGRILMDDAITPTDMRAFGKVVITTVSNPNQVLESTLSISDRRTFERLLQGGEYRLSLKNLPEEYEIRAVTAGAFDLMKEVLTLDGKNPVNVDVRIGLRTVHFTSSVRVAGTVVDSVTGSPSAASRVQLCCFTSGVTERISTKIQPDGSFEFSEVPPGQYTPELGVDAGQTALRLLPLMIEVGSRNIDGLQLLSSPEIRRVILNLELDKMSSAGTPSVVLTSLSGRVRVVAKENSIPSGPVWSLSFYAYLPVNDRYTVSIRNLPPGYGMKSPGVLEVPPEARINGRQPKNPNAVYLNVPITVP